MGRFNVEPMRHMEGDHFRVMVAVEMGMKNHEMVPLHLISMISNIYRGGAAHILRDLCKMNLISYERGRKYDGYRLTNLGYDYLALHALCSREVVGSVGNQIGVGKESDVYVGGDPEMKDLVLKFHRLGRTSFRKLKEKRDYHGRRHYCSWLYLSRIAALKEFSFLKALYARKFPVPQPLDFCRHTVVMGLIDGSPLCNVAEIENPAELYDELMNLIVRLARYGLIHGDFNEFNLILTTDGKPMLIDFPQMVSTDHPNAAYYFNRDVECIREFFRRRFGFESDEHPVLDQIERKHILDVELEASGFTRKMATDLLKAYDEGNFDAHNEESDEEESDEEEDINEEVDEEELDSLEREGQEKKIELGREQTFNNWLQSAQEQIGELDANCPELVEMDESRMEKYKRAIKETEEKLSAMKVEESKDPHSNDLEPPVDEEKPESFEEQTRVRGKVTAPRSVYSTGSTIAPDEERGKAKKEKLRVKGKQSAVQRTRKTNMNTIKEYSGWEDFYIMLNSSCVPGYEGDLKAVIISEGMIRDRIKQLAREIHENVGDQAISLICVLKGSYKFFTTLVDELAIVRHQCKTQLTVDFIRAKSYEDTETTGQLQLIGLSSMDELKDQNVLIVDDIVDSGLTLKRLIQTVEAQSAKNVWTALLLSKRVKREHEVAENYVAFNIPDRFIVGFGLDYNQKFRDLAHIAIMSDAGIEKYKKK
ncbi:Non-specific serine/threonine protein kinase [Aphelenchoides besseyi]|nr:Non-specific serine/threonine protein kinase [Aphelenchoides besseyi]